MEIRKFTPDEIESFRQTLIALGAIKPCARCGSTSWTMHDRMVLLPTGLPTSQDDETTGFLCLALRCLQCGAVVLHSLSEVLPEAIKKAPSDRQL